MQAENKHEQILIYLPVLLFIVFTFLFHLFEIGRATNLILCALIALFTYGMQTANLKIKYGEYPQRQVLVRQTGILTVAFILIFLNGFLHWYKLLHINIRWFVFFILTLGFLILLFHSVRIYQETLKTMEKKK